MKAIRVALVLLLPVLCSAQISQQGIWTNDAMRCAFPVLLNGADINYMGASAPGLYTSKSLCEWITIRQERERSSRLPRDSDFNCRWRRRNPF